MAYINVPNCLEVAYFFNWRGHLSVSAFTYDIASVPVEADLEGYADDAYAGVWQALWRDMSSEDLTFVKVVVTDVTQEFGNFFEKPITGDNVGTVAESSIGNAQAPIITWKTGIRGRSFRGRTYIPGCPITALQTPNFVGTIYRGQMGSLAGLLLSRDPGGIPPGSLVVVSRYDEGAPRVTALATKINSFLANDRLGTQRRRMKEST